MSASKVEGSEQREDELQATPLVAVARPSTEPPLVRVRRELEALIELARTVNSSLDIDDLLPNLMQRTKQLMKVERATLWLLDEPRGRLVSRWSHAEPSVAREQPAGDGVVGWVVRHGEIANLSDPAADPRFDRQAAESDGVTRNLLCAPVRDKFGEVVGVIECANKRSRGFDAEDELLLTCIGAQCAVALANGALYATLRDKNTALLDTESQLRRANSELEVLYAVEQQIASAESVAKLATGVLERLVALSAAEGAALLLAQEHSGQLFVHVRGRASAVRELDASETQQRMNRALYPRRRQLEGSDPDVLVGLSEPVSAREYSTPLSDGRTQIGVLQVVHRADHSSDEATLLGQLAIVAGQLGRGLLLRREREAGEQAQRLAILGHSVGGILHDMRTPLTAVGGYVELMAEEPQPAVRQDYAARVHRALEHMESMTQEVLAFARGQREVLIRKVYLDRFIADVREMLLSEMARVGVNFEIDVQYDGLARFDESKLKRVIWNIARNACEAMSEGGTFRWTIAHDAEHVIFECKDTGPGIAKAIEGRLFESFATHGKPAGTGLGLAMAKKIVDAHCGTISVSSSPGQGATFRIEIPN